MPFSRILLLLLLIAGGCNGQPSQFEAFSADFLLGNASLESPAATSAYTPQSLETTNHRFEGRLELKLSPGAGKSRKHIDWFDYLADPGLSIPDLPPFDFEFVQDGSDLIPVLRGPQANPHPHWEWIIEPGKVWHQPGDQGWSRASLPFSLQERNANCTHNGLLTFLFRSDGLVSRVAYQVGSETCQYLQVDLWGIVPAIYTPGPVRGAQAIAGAYRSERAARLPVKPLEAIAEDHPGSDPRNFNWFHEDEVSTVGFAIDGIHYSGGCGTRYGPYPFCEVLDLPSYSLAKSIFAGMAYMALKKDFDGAGELPVTPYVPECRNDPRWQNVTLENLVDMTTGNYSSLESNVDEYASYETDFMGGDTHALKIETACSLFPRKAEPGTTFAYHTSDTYIAGTLMNAWLREQAPADDRTAKPASVDIHRDVLVEQVMMPLKLSPVTRYSKRTYDNVAQPFAGYGLTLQADDIARLGLFLASGDGSIDGQQLIDRRELKAALQRDPADRGIEAGSPDLRYNDGFWAYRTDLHGACEDPVWIPFMSGYGGISVAILPNRSVFYVFSDKGRFEWLKAAIESNKIRKYCN